MVLLRVMKASRLRHNHMPAGDSRKVMVHMRSLMMEQQLSQQHTVIVIRIIPMSIGSPTHNYFLSAWRRTADGVPIA